MPSPKENWLDTYRGVVHIGTPNAGGDYTVCGLAYDEPASEHSADMMEQTDLPPNCPECIYYGRSLLGTLLRQLRRAGKGETK